MAIDLNADVGKIIKDFLNGNLKKESTQAGVRPSKNSELYKNAILKTIIILCVVLTMSYGINTLTRSPIKKDVSEFKTNEELIIALQKIDENIKSGKDIFTNNKKKATRIIPDFSNQGDSKNLFNLISNLATDNSLIIRNINKGISNKINEPIRYIKNTVFLEIEGFYSNYILFKKQMMENKSILKIESEKITLKKDKFGERRLIINLIITDFAINKEGYEELLKKNL